jgi:hypothetical protein
MSEKLNTGEVSIVLAGETKVLRPTMQAATSLSRIYGGLGTLRDALAAQNIDAAASVIRYGLNLTDAHVKGLTRQIWETGMTAELIVPLIEFVAILGNGGRPVKDQAGDGEGGEASGNAS